MKPLKIKTKILILLLGLACLISVIFYAMSNYFFYKIQNDYNNNIYTSLNHLKDLNNYLAANDYESFSKDYLKLVVNSIFNSIIYNEEVAPNDNNTGKLKVNKILSNNNIKKIIANSISINSTKVADFAIIQNRKIILCSLTGKEGQPTNSFNVWLRKYEVLKKYFSNKNSKNYYKVFTGNKDVYLIVRRFPGTQSYIIGSITPSKIKANTQLASQTVNTIRMLESNIRKDTNDSMTKITYYRIIIIAIVMLLCIPLSFINASKISRPIISLRDQVKKFSEGKFKNKKIEEKGSIEVRDLVKSFNSLGDELDCYMRNLKKEVSERHKLESEIKIAAQIQISSLPNITSDFVRPEFSLASKLSPAEYAAGDFYDFFYITPNRLALIIADVSGKGISAAFYMSLAKATLSSISHHETSPAEAMAKTNHIISENNINCMFVTVFLMFYDIDTGKITYANAGHHDAVVYSKKEKRIRTFGQCTDPSMGILPHISFHENEDQLDIGDTLILYTDGATEAVNTKEVMFGEDELFNIISANINQSVYELSNSIVGTIRKFEEGNLFDDLTLLVLRRNI
ncbi:MAG TPA: SpoIIE family protein phosphatase [Victivallales bacterium]|nr:SpoIIE family protein phosphatase [Victivallales bacterium]